MKSYTVPQLQIIHQITQSLALGAVTQDLQMERFRKQAHDSNGVRGSFDRLEPAAENHAVQIPFPQRAQLQASPMRWMQDAFGPPMHIDDILANPDEGPQRSQ
jgi:hypothetical protein